MMKTPFGTLTLTGIIALIVAGSVIVAIAGASSGSTEAAGFGFSMLVFFGVVLAAILWFKSKFGGKGNRAPRGALRQARFQEARELSQAQAQVQQWTSDAVAQAQRTAEVALADAHARAAHDQGRWV